MKVMLNSETMLAEIALTEVSSRLVCTYRDLIELRSLPKTDELGGKDHAEQRDQAHEDRG